MKKAVAIFMAVAMTLGMAACGSKKEETKASETSKTTAAANTEKADDTSKADDGGSDKPVKIGWLQKNRGRRSGSGAGKGRWHRRRVLSS